MKKVVILLSLLCFIVLIPSTRTQALLSLFLMQQVQQPYMLDWDSDSDSDVENEVIASETVPTIQNDNSQRIRLGSNNKSDQCDSNGTER